MRRYIKLHTVILSNPKVLGLSSDAARWHFARLLLHGKMTEPEGRWLNLTHLRSSVGEDTFAHVAEFMTTEPEGLLVERPDGVVAVRQWWLWQGADSKARQGDLSGRQQEKKRTKWARQKAAQRAQKRPPPGHDVHPTDVHPNGGHDVHPDVHHMSTDVHPNREKDSLPRTADTTADPRLASGPTAAEGSASGPSAESAGVLLERYGWKPPEPVRRAGYRGPS
jgi:hypothetical protein